MLMVQDKPQHVTPQAMKLLESLRNAQGLTRTWLREQSDNVLMPFGDEWLNRSMLAWSLGKQRLTPYDIALLELLESKGYIESRQLPAALGQMWVYRAKS